MRTCRKKIEEKKRIVYIYINKIKTATTIRITAPDTLNETVLNGAIFVVDYYESGGVCGYHIEDVSEAKLYYLRLNHSQRLATTTTKTEKRKINGLNAKLF